MGEILSPLTIRDYSKGRIAKAVVAPSLVPPNSVADCRNVVFDEQIGGAKVRKGNSLLYQVETDSASGQQQLTANASTAIVDGANWYAQTFTPAVDQDTTVGVSLLLYRVGAPTNLTVQLVKVSGGVPDTSVVYSKDVLADTSSITTGTAGAVYDFLLPPTDDLPADGVIQYAIVVSCTGDGSNNIIWRSNTAGGYAGGSGYSSTNSGSSWSIISGQDFYFIVYYDAGIAPQWPTRGFILHNFSGIVTNALVTRGVIAYLNDIQSARVLYFLNSSGNWQASDQRDITDTGFQRFAVLDNYFFTSSVDTGMLSSGDFGATWTTLNCITVPSSLLYVTKNVMLSAGNQDFPSRVYISTVVDPNSSPFITWDSDPATGRWIDVDPDKGGIVTGFSDASSVALVFKENSFYRLDVVNDSVDPDNIYTVGAVSQEAITKCLGLVYFWSGKGIYSTDGGFPQQIDRIGVSDLMADLTPADPVYLNSDGLDVYVSFDDLVLKFSPRDQTWTVLKYSQLFGVGQIYFFDANSLPQFAYQTNKGAIMTINDVESQDMSDDGEAIPYYLESQELEINGRENTKVISDQIVVFTEDGTNGTFLVKANDEDYKSAVLPLNDRVNIGINNNFRGNWFTYKWMGTALGNRPLLQGVMIAKITDEGIVTSV